MAYQILCVDDEEAILTLFKRVFEPTEYEVFTARNGVEALGNVRAHRPDIVFLDVAMPQMSGEEALPLIHEIDPEAAVVIVSGKVTEDKARELLTAGAFDFLPKPIDLQHLLDITEQWRRGKDLE